MVPRNPPKDAPTGPIITRKAAFIPAFTPIMKPRKNSPSAEPWLLAATA